MSAANLTAGDSILIRTLILYKLEYLTECRNSGALLRLVFAPLLLFLCAFALSGRSSVLDAHALSLLFWVPMASSCMLSPLHLFSREIDERTLHFSGQFFAPSEIFAAKTLFSLTQNALSAIMSTVVFFVFIRETDFAPFLLLSISAQLPLGMLFVLPAFFSALLKGGYALAALTAMPFLFPVFSLAVEESASVINGGGLRIKSLVFFVSLSIFVAVVSLLLAHPVWRSYENS